MVSEGTQRKGEHGVEPHGTRGRVPKSREHRTGKDAALTEPRRTVTERTK
jgi:hypothetical protein